MKQEIRTTRLEWVDFARCCAMILTIIGHSVGKDDGGSFLRGAIFSFHMPMFFFLSAVTMKLSSGREEMLNRIRKDAKHLLVPFLLIWIVTFIADLICGYVTFGDWKEKLFSLIFASGTSAEFAGLFVPGLGSAWFLLCLFTVRTIFDYLHHKLPESMLFVVSMLCGILGVMIGTQQYLAFSFDISLAVMPIFYLGYRYGSRQRQMQAAGKKGKYSAALQLIWPAVWIVTLLLTFPDVKLWTYMELAIRRYSLFPVSYVCALAGTMMIIAFSILCCRTRYMKRPVLVIGKYCLYLYMIHMLDPYWRQLYEIADRQFITALLRTVIDLAILAVVLLAVSGVRRVLHRR